MARPRTNIHPRILLAAAKRFSDVGVDGASLRSIAKLAKTSIGMVYYYFPTKDDLFFAVIEDAYARLLEDLSRALDQTLRFESRVERFYARLGSLGPEELRILRLVAVEVIGASPRLPRLVERFKHGHIALLFQLAAEGIATGILRQDVDPHLAMAALLSLGSLPHLFMRVGGKHIPSVPQLVPAEMAAQLTSVLLHGLGAVKS